MEKTIFMKSFFLLLYTVFAGVLDAHAQDYDYEWVKVTDLSMVGSGDLVVVASGDQLALRNDELMGVFAASITISDGIILDENVAERIQWTLTKQEDENGTSFKFASPSYAFLSAEPDGYGSYSVVIGATDPNLSVTDFIFENYGQNGGKLYYTNNNYIRLNDNNKAVVGSPGSNFTLYKKTVKNYVKWKRVNNLDVILEPNDSVVIVDLATGRAMSNDKADKDPDAVAVDLNDDKDRITGDVAEKVKWAFTTSNEGYKFAVGENNLYATSDGLRVGTETSNNEFGFSYNDVNGNYMSITIDNTQYFAVVEESMFSNSWKLVEGTDDKAKDGKIAIFKKVVSPQKIVTIELAEYYNYDINEPYAFEAYDFNEKVTITGAEKEDIEWSSSNTAVATITAQGGLTLVGRGTTVITAIVKEEGNHDKASAKCTLIVDDSSTAGLGTLELPLTVAEAKDLAEKGQVEHDGTVYLTWEEGVNYYVKGKVSKVNSGLMAMFGDMDMGSIGGGEGMDFDDMMDDMDFDMDSMDDMGFDMSSLGFDMSSLFGSSDKVTYYISDDGTKDNQMKVVNGCGTVKVNGFDGMEFNEIPKLSPGDCVVVCGPIVYTEDSSMFSGMMGGGDENEPKKSAKVDEMNYLAVYDPTLLVKEPEKEIYVNKTLDGSVTDPLAGNSLYEIDNLFDEFGETKISVEVPDGAKVEAPTYKSSDEDIAKWDEDTKKIVGVNIGTAKITVKVKVVLQEKVEGDDDSKEKSYTMKRKFKLTVKTRDLLPAGYYDGEWVLTTDTDDLLEGTLLVLAGTRVKDGNETDYMMVDNSSMMGGGKSGSKIEFDDTSKETIPSSTVISKGGLEIVLEKDENDANFWNLNVGIDEKDTPLYLYATASTSTEEGNGIMDMFSPSSGMKVGTKEDAAKDAEEEDVVVSLKATISFSDNIATIKFDGIADDKNNTIMLTSAFDMDAMMEMFGGQGEGEGQQGEGEGQGSSTPSFDMGSFDMFMASFNTKKPGDKTAEEGKDPKCFMPRIYRFVPFETFDIAIGTTEWRTIVTYKDVKVPDNVEAYIVKEVQPEETQSLAVLTRVDELAGGEPYLLHTSQPGSYALELLTPYTTDELDAPEGNLLMKSNRKTNGTKTSSAVYVLANKTKGYGFYRWTGDDLGAGRVYLPVGASETTAGAHEYCGFFVDETTAIESIDDFKANVGPFYDLQGRRVDNPTKGIYIVNGKKVIVK